MYPALNPCLRVEEIFLSVCSFLDTNSLFHLSLACRRFKEPALRTLWREVFYKTGDALECLLLDSIIKRGTDLQHAVGASGWLNEANPTYLSYVRHADLELRCLNDDLNEAPQNAFKHSFIFPNLRFLSYTHGCSEFTLSYSFLNTLLAPSLTKLSLEISLIDINEDAIGTFSLLYNCPSVTEFELTYDVFTFWMDPIILKLWGVLSNAVSRWPKLKTLTIPTLTTEGFGNVSQFQDLHKFIIKPTQAYGMEPTIPSGFKSLHTLGLSGWGLDRVVEFLGHVQTSTLADVKINLGTEGITAAQWEAFVSSIFQKSSLSNKLAVEVSSHHRGTPDTDDDIIVEVLRPLFTARNLIQLDLGSFSYFGLHDAFIEDLARASPQLETLIFDTEYSDNRSPTLTLGAVAHVLNNCPKICTLGLEMDTSSVPEYLKNMVLKETSQLHNGSFALWVGRSRAEEPQQIAAFLASFFYTPISNIRPAGSTPLETSVAWHAVLHLTNELIKAKKY